MKSKLPDRKRVLRWIVIFILVVLSLLYLALPASFGVAAVYPSREAVGESPQGFDEITLIAAGGVNLGAWYLPPVNGAVIILLHGAGGSREGLRPYASMLSRQGYGVLAMDLRGHGESGGTTNRLGWQGTADVGAAVEFLQARDEVRAIGGLGQSMGGEVLLGAVSQYPALQAIVTEGATHRSTGELLALPSERPLYRNFTARVMYAVVRLLTGDEPPKPLLDSMIESQTRRFLLIAGGNEQMEVEFNKLFAEKLGDRAELWVAPDADHTAAYSRYPAEYEQRVIEFFRATLIAESQLIGD